MSPTTSVTVRVARPCAFRAVTTSGYSPGRATAPFTEARSALKTAPGGRPATAISIGRSPVTGTR